MFGFLSQRKHLFLLLLYPVVGFGFSICEALVPRVVNVMEWQPFDGWIPFVPAMVWPYVIWYLTVIFALGWTGWRKDGGEFKRLAAFLYLGMSSAYVVYLLYPNGQNLRPLDQLGEGWDYDVLRWIYSHDTPTNCNPSIHVIDAMAVWIALARDRLLKTKAWFQFGIAVLSVAIIASTVLIKQHSIVDVFGGLAWAGMWYLLIYSRWSPLFPTRL